MVGSALAALLVLTAVQAQGPRPSVDVSKTFDAATETTAGGTITIYNVSDEPIDVTIETIDDNLFYTQGPEPWTCGHGHRQRFSSRRCHPRRVMRGRLMGGHLHPARGDDCP